MGSWSWGVDVYHRCPRESCLGNPRGKESPQLQGPQYRWEGGEADSPSSVILMPPSLDLRETASTAVGPGGPVRTQRQAGGGRKAALSTMRLAALSCR